MGVVAFYGKIWDILRVFSIPEQSFSYFGTSFFPKNLHILYKIYSKFYSKFDLKNLLIFSQLPCEAMVEKGRNLLEKMPKMHSSAMTPVFYQSKMKGFDGDLQLEDICGEINWGTATDLIK